MTSNRNNQGKDTWLLQVGDLHLLEVGKDTLSVPNCVSSIKDQVNNLIPCDSQIILAICGDITSKGDKQGYELSIDFFRQLNTALNRKIGVVIAPGNHDIAPHISASHSRFSSFNQAAWDIGQKQQLSETITAISHAIGDIEFIIVNSAYHAEHAYGKVDIQSLRQLLSKQTSLDRIVIVHHHSFAVDSDKSSGLRNSYEFLQVCVSNKSKAILHGHGHMDTSLSVGVERCQVIGVGSLFYPPNLNFNNQFNIIRISNGQINLIKRYRYQSDSIGLHGELGTFVSENLPTY